MKTFFTRTATGIVFVVVMVGAILWSQYSYLLLMTVILAGTLNEYFNITASKREQRSNKIPIKWFVIILSLLVFWRSFLLTSPPVQGTPNLENMVVAFFQGLFRLRDSNITMTALIPIFAFILF